MVSVAAGLAKEGLRPWVYSIAPFLYARAFEQIRNDVCLHRMPVTLVGNGGGYGYGVMGSTHHAIEDYGTLLSLPGMRVYLPAFDCDVSESIRYLMRADHPAYLRLGLSEQPKWFSPPPFSAWRHLLTGVGPTIAIAGPIAAGILNAIRQSRPISRRLARIGAADHRAAFRVFVQSSPLQLLNGDRRACMCRRLWANARS